MTDTEIIKALECCASDYINACDDCHFQKRCLQDEKLEVLTLDLIKRQKAEIENFKANIIPRLKKANQACKFLGRENQLLKREITNLRMLLADEGLLEDEE